jgi:hypothetical protein
LTLLIHTKHYRSIRPVQAQPHDIPHLLNELRILRELEVLRDVDLLAYGTLGTANWIFAGDGRGNFRQAGIVDPAVSAVLAVADLNSDGKTDLILQLATNEAGVSLSEGNNHFSQPRQVFRLEWKGPQGKGPSISRVSVCDLNRDGKPDLVISYGRDHPLTALLLGNGDGKFTELPGSPFDFAIWVVADFNRDGASDLLDMAGRIRFGRGNGTFRLQEGGLSGSPCSFPRVVDIDGDGTPDVVCGEDAGWGTSWASIYRGDGNGGFYLLPQQENLVWETGAGPEFADFSGDGIPDALLVPNVALGAILYLGNGMGGFAPTATLPNCRSLRSSWTSTVIGNRIS